MPDQYESQSGAKEYREDNNKNGRQPENQNFQDEFDDKKAQKDHEENRYQYTKRYPAHFLRAIRRSRPLCSLPRLYLLFYAVFSQVSIKFSGERISVLTN